MTMQAIASRSAAFVYTTSLPFESYGCSHANDDIACGDRYVRGCLQ